MALLTPMNHGKLKGGWRITRRTAKTVTIFLPSSNDLGPKFTGRTFQFRWDGTGYKRQGEYLEIEDPAPADEAPEIPVEKDDAYYLRMKRARGRQAKRGTWG